MKFTKQDLIAMRYHGSYKYNGVDVPSVNLLSNENGSFQFNLVDYTADLVNLKTATLLNGKPYFYAYMPMAESESLDGLVDKVNEMLDLQDDNLNPELLPIDYEAYYKLMDDKLQSEPNVRTINKFLEAVGLPIKVQYIKKRRNRQQYEVIVISESVAQFSCGGSFDLRVDDAKITTFVNKLLELIVETLHHLNRLFSYKCRELFVIPVHGFGVGACRLRFRNNCCTMKNIDGILLQNSLIRYFNEFVHISSRDKIKLEKLLSYNSALSVLGEPYIRNYGFYFVIKRGLFSSTFSEVLNTPAHPLFAASCYSGHIFNLPDCSDPVLHSNLISHYNNMVDQEFRSHNDVVNNWFSSSISSVPELRTGV